MKHMKRFSPEWMAYTGLLVAMQVVLGNILQIPFEWKQFNFGFLPVAVAGALMGAPSAIIVGGLGDFLGAHLFSTGAYNFCFTGTWMIVGLLYGLILYAHKESMPRVLACCAAVACANLFLNTLWLSLWYIPRGYGVLLATRWWTYLPEIVLQTLLVFASVRALRQLPAFRGNDAEQKDAK